MHKSFQCTQGIWHNVQIVCIALTLAFHSALWNRVGCNLFNTMHKSYIYTYTYILCVLYIYIYRCTYTLCIYTYVSTVCMKNVYIYIHIFICMYRETLPKCTYALCIYTYVSTPCMNNVYIYIHIFICIYRKTLPGDRELFWIESARTRSDADAVHMRKVPGIMQMRQTRQMLMDEDACIRNWRQELHTWNSQLICSFDVSFEI